MKGFNAAGIVEIQTDICTYKILCSGSEKVALIGIDLLGNEPVKFKIPKVLPSGHIIDCIGPLAEFKGFTWTLIIDDKISSIKNNAFSYVKAKEFHWPSSCRRIPESCFRYNNTIESIYGTEHITEIEPHAFEDSHLRYFSLPQSCPQIPKRCFMNSFLEKIDGLENVREIGNRAFAGATKLKSLDLTGVPYCRFADGSLAGVDRTIVKFPYFATEEQRADAFFGVLE